MVSMRAAVRVARLSATTSSMLSLYMAHRKVSGRLTDFALRDAWVKAWSKRLLDIFSIDLSTAGALPAKTERGLVVVANHRSAIDISVLFSVFGGQFVSRGDLSTWPLLGFGAKAIGTLFVDRSDPRSGANLMRRMQAALEEGATVLIFPEGTTFEGDDVRPFHQGAARVAKAANVPMLPVGLAYEAGSNTAFVGTTFGEHVKRVAKTPKTRVALEIGTPIEPGEERPKALLERAHAEVSGLVLRARARVDA